MAETREFIWDGNKAAYHPKLDEIRSQLGGYSTNAASVTDFTIISSESVASGNTFHLTDLIVTNTNAAADVVVLYGIAAGTSEKLRVVIGSSETIAITDMKGLTFVYSESVFAQVRAAATGVYVRAGGIRRPTALYKE